MQCIAKVQMARSLQLLQILYYNIYTEKESVFLHNTRGIYRFLLIVMLMVI